MSKRKGIPKRDLMEHIRSCEAIRANALDSELPISSPDTVAQTLVEYDPDGRKALEIAEKYVRKAKPSSPGKPEPRS